ncbi:monocarboxylate transporter 12 [Lasius niger]|uniref:Monocarboxylate transporter 12 n=1 Tax=Lasius niger TaxID=67767 RepID=A0A0J7KE71_LASNI|nr:monocarboxylate transporter 12 [Lasius niger]
MTENTKKDSKKPPDGGWGWFVCLGSSLITLSLRSLDPSFGLLFQDLLEELDVNSTRTSVIMSVLDAIVNFSGLGTGLATACSFVALNTFFDKKRGQAVGFSMAGTALGMMLVPLLIHMLLELYGFRGTTLIMGGWALHSVMGSCLLRPLEERSLPLPQPVEKKTDKERESEALLMKTNPSGSRRMSNGSTWTENQKAEDASKLSSKSESFMKKIKATFDLDLLKNSTYLNVSLGCSLYYVAESNFKLMMPFFLSDIDFKTIAIYRYSQYLMLAVLPMLQCFGLIFAERFMSLGIAATQTSLILHLNGTITCSLGLISGPMMKRFAFRQVAYFGCLTIVLGICAAAFAVSLPTLIITYCVIIGT